MTNGIMPKLEYLNPPKYDQYSKYREYLRKATDFSCAYCTISESESPGATFNIDHFRPQKEFPSLEDGFSAQQDAFAIVKLVQRMCVKKTSRVLLIP